MSRSPSIIAEASSGPSDNQRLPGTAQAALRQPKPSKRTRPEKPIHPARIGRCGLPDRDPNSRIRFARMGLHSRATLKQEWTSPSSSVGLPKSPQGSPTEPPGPWRLNADEIAFALRVEINTWIQSSQSSTRLLDSGVSCDSQGIKPIHTRQGRIDDCEPSQSWSE